MKEYRVKIKMAFDVVRYIAAESEEDAMEIVEGEDDIYMPEDGTYIDEIEADEARG